MLSVKNIVFSSTTFFFVLLLANSSQAKMCLATYGVNDYEAGGGATILDLQNDSKNCGKKGKVCSQIDYCHKGKCVTLPKQTMFCAEEKKWCMATCNDGFVVRNLCSPCKDACKSACKNHNGCKSTCSEVTEVAYTKKCILA